MELPYLTGDLAGIGGALRASDDDFTVAEREVGIAAMKDRHAVTRQWLSLPPPVQPDAVRALALDNITILEVVRHPHKLRTGHVRGNRFVLRVRGVGSDAAGRAPA